MATFDDLINNFETVANGLKKHMEDNLLITANDSVDDIVQRIKKTGRDADGNLYKDYSDGYKKKKIKKGRYAGFVDFTYTNVMLRSIGVHGKNIGNGIASVTVSPSSTESAKLQHNEERRGEILRLSQKEKEQLNEDFNSRILEYLETLSKNG